MELFDRIARGEFDGPVRPSRPNAEQSAAFNEAMKKAHESFKRALEQEYVHQLFPERVLERMFEMAWELGHATSLRDIATYYEELAAFKEME
jgi:hypothetical protein